MKEINFKNLLKTKIELKKKFNCKLKDVIFLCEFKGGMSNKNYLFEVNEKKYVVHISEKGYELFVNREDEYSAMDILKEFKYSQKPVILKDTLRVFDYIDGVSMNTIDYNKYKNEIAKSFHQLHDTKKLVKNDYKPFEFLESMKNSLHEEYDKLFIESYDLLIKNKTFLESRPLVLCHNDLQPSNLVLKDNEVYILDFEFAKNNDYLFDLATYGNLNFNDSLELLKVYKPDYTEEELKALKLWRIFVNCQWYLVALKKFELGYDKKLNMSFKDISMFFLSKNREIIDTL